MAGFVYWCFVPGPTEWLKEIKLCWVRILPDNHMDKIISGESLEYLFPLNHVVGHGKEAGSMLGNISVIFITDPLTCQEHLLRSFPSTISMIVQCPALLLAVSCHQIHSHHPPA